MSELGPRREGEPRDPAFIDRMLTDMESWDFNDPATPTEKLIKWYDSMVYLSTAQRLREPQFDRLVAIADRARTAIDARLGI